MHPLVWILTFIFLGIVGLSQAFSIARAIRQRNRLAIYALLDRWSHGKDAPAKLSGREISAYLKDKHINIHSVTVYFICNDMVRHGFLNSESSRDEHGVRKCFWLSGKNRLYQLLDC